MCRLCEYEAALMGRQRTKNWGEPTGLDGDGRWLLTGPQEGSAPHLLHLTLLERKKLHTGVTVTPLCPACVLGVLPHHQEGESKSNATRTVLPSPIILAQEMHRSGPAYVFIDGKMAWTSIPN